MLHRISKFSLIFQERTEALQTAFFISFDGKENIDPSGNKTPLKDDQPTPSIGNCHPFVSVGTDNSDTCLLVKLYQCLANRISF